MGRNRTRKLISKLVSCVLVSAFVIGGVAFLALPSVSATTWSPSVLLTPNSAVYFGLEIGLGQSSTYVLTWSYDSGPVAFFKSSDDGITWSTADIVSGALYADPGMCVWSEGASDTILAAYGPGIVLKSGDSGSSFSQLSTLPLNYYADSWRFISIGTNASMRGTTPDNDVYVVGSQHIFGTYVVSFTKSADGGKSWKEPVMISTLDRYTAFAKLVSDGQNIYIVYSASDYGYTDLYVRSSSDWGTTWSAEKVLLQKQAGSAWMCAYSLQNLDSSRALLTCANYWSVSSLSPNPTGIYGYLNYADMSFQEVGNVSGSDWNVAGGFAGKLRGSELCLAWIKGLGFPITEVRYTSSPDSGLALQPQGKIVDKGARPVTWTFTPASSGTWNAVIDNHGLKSIGIAISDVSARRPSILMMQKIDFADMGAYPTGEVFSDRVTLFKGHEYMIFAVALGGSDNSYALIWDNYE